MVTVAVSVWSLVGVTWLNVALAYGAVFWATVTENVRLAQRLPSSHTLSVAVVTPTRTG